MKQNQNQQGTDVSTDVTEKLERLANIRADQVTDADVVAVSLQVGLGPAAWDYENSKKIIAAAVRVILTR